MGTGIPTGQDTRYFIDQASALKDIVNNKKYNLNFTSIETQQYCFSNNHNQAYILIV